MNLTDRDDETFYFLLRKQLTLCSLGNKQQQESFVRKRVMYEGALQELEHIGPRLLDAMEREIAVAVANAMEEKRMKDNDNDGDGVVVGGGGGEEKTGGDRR